MSISFKSRRKALVPIFLGALALACLIYGCMAGVWDNFQKVLDQLELTLLDQRIRFRADSLTPSSDVLIVAFDQASDEYFSNHPEFGINNRVLPRNQLAKVLDYLSSQGVKSNILDIELKYPSTEADDTALAAAIRNSGNVYLAAYVDKSFSEFLKQEINADTTYGQTYRKVAFFSQYLEPYLHRKIITSGIIGRSCTDTFSELGFGIFNNLQEQLPMAETAILPIWESMCQASQFQPQENTTAPSSEPPLLNSTADPLLNAYARLCMIDKYEQLYRQKPEFLEGLKHRSLGFQMVKPPDFEEEKRFSYCRISPILDQFLQPAAGIGISTVEYEQDAYLRMMPLFYKAYGGKFYPLLPASPVFHATSQAKLRYQPELASLSGRAINLFEGNKVIVNWRSPKRLAKTLYAQANRRLLENEAKEIRGDIANPQLAYGHLYRFISVADILKKIKDPSDTQTPSLYRIYADPISGLLSLKGKQVIYGDTIKDVHRTPIGNVTYGPEVMATMLDSLSNDRLFVHQSPVWMNILAVLMLCSGICLSITRLPRLPFGIAGGVIFIGVFWLYNFWAFRELALWLPLATPSLLAFLAFLSAIVFRYYVQDREKRYLSAAFSRYVSPQVMEEILLDPQQALNNLKGNKKELTVLFSDLHNFTSQFEKADPEVMVAQLNEYFNAMTNIVLKHGGTYDKYMGDALMAFFGAPKPMGDHADKACLAALEMRTVLAEMNQEWAKIDMEQLKHGIGISTGEMFVGNFGADEIKNFTVIGSNVNLGARLETYTRSVDADIIVSQGTMEHVGQRFNLQGIGDIELKGFSDRIPAYILKN